MLAPFAGKWPWTWYFCIKPSRQEPQRAQQGGGSILRGLGRGAQGWPSPIHKWKTCVPWLLMVGFPWSNSYYSWGMLWLMLIKQDDLDFCLKYEVGKRRSKSPLKAHPSAWGDYCLHFENVFSGADFFVDQTNHSQVFALAGMSCSFLASSYWLHEGKPDPVHWQDVG